MVSGDELGIWLSDERDIEVRFACFPDCAISTFERTDPEWEERTPVWVLSEMEGGWRPRFLGKKVIVSMFDACPLPYLQPHEYRIWNEYVIGRLVRGLRGSGVLTISHRPGWPWHFGLSWSRYPLDPCNRLVTEQPPVWWGAVDLWADLPGGFVQLYHRVRVQQRRWEADWDRQVAERRALLDAGLIEPARRLPDAELADFRRRIEEVRAGAFEEEGRQLPPRRDP
jgi:hypothetical protein